MKLIVGLGNPGDQYKNTRHNVGFMFMDVLAGRLNEKWTFDKKSNAEIIKTQKFLVAKPQTFMNSSGEAVGYLTHYYKITPSNVYIVHDDLDIPLGQYKIDFAKGPKVHGGINSIIDHLHTDDFWRVRIGVDNRDPDNRILGEEYVLQPFLKEEKEIIHKVISQILRSEEFNL